MVTKFQQIMGRSPRIKIIEFLLEGFDLDFPVTLISEETKVSRLTVNKHLKDLVKYKVVTQTRTLGSSKMYKLNKEHELVKSLKELFHVIVFDKLYGEIKK